MSKVAIAGNASGTGTFTIASPNSNTDRTLTLPDDTGTVVYQNTSGNVGIGTSSPQGPLEVVGVSWFTRNSKSTSINPDYGSAGTHALITTPTSMALAFATNGDNERMRIDSGGAVLMGKTVTNDTTQGFAWRSSGYVSIVRDGGAPLSLVRNSSTGEIQEFFYNTTKVGSISTNGSNTAYNTSSDYRLKENIAPMTGALATVQQLNPVTYNWKLDGSAGQGFIAHELQAVVPDCVTGEKDAVDAEGKPVYQGIDTSFLVATLTAAIKELKAELDAAKDRIAALEGGA